MKKFVQLLGLMLAGLLTMACANSHQEAEGLDIVTSFYPVYAITDYVTGDLNQVAMIQSKSGIHHFEPSANDIAAIEQSDVFIFHSTTLESWAKNLTDLESTEVIEATEGIELKYVPGLEGFEVPEGMDEKALYDPHSWNDPFYAAKEAHVIADRLSELDPENQEYYQANADQFEEEAVALAQKYEDSLKSKTNNNIVTQHTAFQYICDTFGLEEIGIGGVSEEIEPSAKRMSQIIQYIEDNDIPIIFKERNASGKFAETVAQELGISVEILDPLEADPENGKSFLDNMEINLKTLDENLK